MTTPYLPLRWTIHSPLHPYLHPLQNLCCNPASLCYILVAPMNAQHHRYAADLYALLYTRGERELRAGRLANFTLCYDLCTAISLYCERLHATTLGLSSSTDSPAEPGQTKTH